MNGVARGYMIGIQSIFTRAWKTRVMMPRISGSTSFYTYLSTVDEVLFVCAKDRLADISAVTK